MTLSLSPDAVADPGLPATAQLPIVRTGTPREHHAAAFPQLPRIVFGGGILLVAILFAAGAWQRRWIADDGLIVLRTVRNLLAGNGPVFNMGERVETNTSTAWTYVVWFFSWLTQGRLEYVVLTIALTLSVLAVVIAMLGAGRLWGGTRSTLLVPAGALVYIALPPARDYATSGLENCLVIFWLAVLWWGLMRWAQAETVRPAAFFGLVFWAGLAPLIRPELTVVGGLAVLLLCCAPVPRTRLRPWMFRVLIGVVAGLTPIAYQIWRMGYYALPFPNTAVAKDAGGAKWHQGFIYLQDLAGPYLLWLPLLILGIWAGVALRERRIRWAARRLRAPATIAALMIGSGILLTVYELRVGGDFMHGRMLLPQLFCLLAPVMVLPIRLGRDRTAVIALVTLACTAGWALFAANITAITSGTEIRSSGIVDERIYYVLNGGHDHPILAEDYLDYPRMRPLLRDIGDTPNGGLVVNLPDQTYWYVIPPPQPVPEGGAGHTVLFLNLGMTSMNLPLHVRVIDPMGLAYPLAAHTDRVTDGRIGHDKNLNGSWVVADTGVVDKHPWMAAHIEESAVARSRAALSCPTTQDLLASVRAPLTFTRFRHNLMQALTFANTRIDRIPRYELQRCDLADPIPK
ncbi:flagellar motor control protein ZomB [Nocardia sp. NPDC056000]|uniref:flagellar motor control protein ZomB n=1 Tax=Nocardia sp. NPDC056000 TaxID=3345674 RepID=UPI0035E36CE2